MSNFLKSLLLMLFCSLSSKAAIIPATNMVDFTPGLYTGVRGGIPTTNDWPIWTNAHTAGIDWTGVTNIIPILQTLVLNCPASNCIYFPSQGGGVPGRYRFAQILILTGSGGLTRGDIMFVGDGPTLTKWIDGTTNGNALINAGEYSGSGYYSSGGLSITGGLSQFSTNMILPSVAGLSVGDYGWLSSTYDYPDLQVMSSGNSRRIFGQYVSVLAISGNTVTIDKPLCWTIPTNNTPRFRAASVPRGQIYFRGLELTHTNEDNNYESNIGMSFLLTELRNFGVVDFKHTFQPASHSYTFNIENSQNFEFRRCELWGNAAGGPNHAEIIVGGGSGMLIEDNWFFLGGPPIEFQRTTISAVSYNFFTNETAQSPYSGYSVSVHGPHTAFIMSEGNKGVKYQQDSYFGSASQNHFLRNHWHGNPRRSDATLDWFNHAIQIGRWTTHCYLLGNVLGDTGLVYTAFQPTNKFAVKSNWCLVQQYPNPASSFYDTNTVTPATDYRWIGDKFWAGIYADRPTFCFVMTNSGSGTTLPGIFTNLLTDEAIIFQTAGNTNLTYPADANNTSCRAVATGTSTGVTLTSSVTWNTGDIAWSIGQAAGDNYPYWLRTTGNTNTIWIHGNWDYFNNDVVWDANIADHSIPDSYLGRTQSTDWMTNYLGQRLRFPIIDGPTKFINVLPAESRMYQTAGTIVDTAIPGKNSKQRGNAGGRSKR